MKIDEEMAIASIVVGQCDAMLEQIEIFRILLKEMSVKISDFDQTIRELRHTAEEGFYVNVE